MMLDKRKPWAVSNANETMQNHNLTMQGQVGAYQNTLSSSVLNRNSEAHTLVVHCQGEQESMTRLSRRTQFQVPQKLHRAIPR